MQGNDGQNVAWTVYVFTSPTPSWGKNFEYGAGHRQSMQWGRVVMTGDFSTAGTWGGPEISTPRRHMVTKGTQEWGGHKTWRWGLFDNLSAALIGAIPLGRGRGLPEAWGKFGCVSLRVYRGSSLSSNRSSRELSCQEESGRCPGFADQLRLWQVWEEVRRRPKGLQRVEMRWR